MKIFIKKVLMMLINFSPTLIQIAPYPMFDYHLNDEILVNIAFQKKYSLKKILK